MLLKNKLKTYPKVCLLLVFCSCYCSLTFAQKEKYEGYVIDLQQDTIIGEIKFTERSQSPKLIQFIQEGGKSVKYDLSSMLEFGIKNEMGLLTHIYRRKNVRLDIRPEKVYETDISETEYVEDQVFVRVLVDGVVSLYKYESSYGKSHLLIEKEGKGIEELIFKKYYDKFLRYVKNIQQYKAQILERVKDCADVNSKIATLQFAESKIMSLINQYNQACTVENNYILTLDKGDINWHFNLAYTNSVLRFTGANYNDIRVAQWNDYHGVSLGSAFAFTPAKYNHNVTVLAELQVRPFITNGFHQEAISENQYFSKDYNIKLLYTSLNMAIRYRLFQAKVSPFLEASYSGAFLTYWHQETVKNATFYSTNTTDVYPILDHKVRRYERGWLLGAGISYKRYNLIYRYGRSDGMSKAPAIGSKFRHYFLQLEYRM